MAGYRDAVELRAERARELRRAVEERRAELDRLGAEAEALRAEWARVNAFVKPAGRGPRMVAGAAVGILLVPVGLAIVLSVIGAVQQLLRLR